MQLCRMFRLIAVPLFAATIWLFFAACPSPGGSSNPFDLAPGTISYGGTPVRANGDTLSITMPVDNLLAVSESAAFSVEFHITNSSAFKPATDAKIGSATVTGGVPGSSSVGVSTTLTMPASLAAAGLTANECAYVYAVVDPSGALADSNTANNVSTVSTAAVVLVYSSGPYNLLVETYAASGAPATTNVGIALFQKNGSTTMVDYPTNNNVDIVPAPGFYGSLSVSAMPSGTYYVRITGVGGSLGPFVLQVHSANISQVTLPALSSDPDSSNDQLLMDDGHLTPYNGPIPTPTTLKSLSVGTALSWYIPSGDQDWFTFTLP
jgi:hypothetical protein